MCCYTHESTPISTNRAYPDIRHKLQQTTTAIQQPQTIQSHQIQQAGHYLIQLPALKVDGAEEEQAAGVVGFLPVQLEGVLLGALILTRLILLVRQLRQARRVRPHRRQARRHFPFSKSFFLLFSQLFPPFIPRNMSRLTNHSPRFNNVSYYHELYNKMITMDSLSFNYFKSYHRRDSLIKLLYIHISVCENFKDDR